MRRRIIGVDFSGAADAGNKIWIAEGEVGPGGLALESCIPARSLPGGARARRPAIAALRTHLAKANDAAIGMDFPFSLPEAFVEPRDWGRFVQSFAMRFPTADAFRATMRSLAAGKEPKRRTDKCAETPMGPWNLWLYKQTWHGIAELLAPMIDTDSARFAPMQNALGGKPLIVEACPASLLKALDLYAAHRSYKGSGTEKRSHREAILDAVEGERLLRASDPELRSSLLNNRGGDALDAVLAAICAMRGCADPNNLKPRDETDLLEARVFY